MKRYEAINEGGVSWFYDEFPPNSFRLKRWIVDHHNICVLEAPDGTNLNKLSVGQHEELYAQVIATTHLSKAIRVRLVNGTPILFEEWQTFRMNSYERQHMAKLLTPGAIIQVLEKHMLPNCARLQRAMPTTYDEDVLHTFLPLLIDKTREWADAKDIDVTMELTRKFMPR